MNCDSRFGFSQCCQLAAGHDGRHDSGRITWTESESATSTAAINQAMRGKTE